VRTPNKAEWYQRSFPEMEESQFQTLADAQLMRLERSIETALDHAGIDADIESKPGGILEIEFENGTKLIINRHLAAREIWVAARSGGFHFRPQGGAWINTRSGEGLESLLARVISEQTGVAVDLPGGIAG
jgi:CyaY protein